MKTVTPEEFADLLPFICDRETSSDPDNWTPENPLWGHCAVVSLIAQDLFGGKLFRTSLLDIPEFARMRSHYKNAARDFTASQFGDHYPEDRVWVEKKRSDVLSPAHPETKERYKLLASRIAEVISDGNSLFDDAIYLRCFYEAMDSACQKMRFGCVITTHNGEIIYGGCNANIEPLKSMCDPKCMRFFITSRTESMLGACGHAEEHGLWEIVRQGIPLDECELYIAGFNGIFPWMKTEPEHTCLRCAVQMYNAKLKKIYVPVVDRWVGISPEQALETARAYATQEKKV